jgi:hypothetical protein
MEAAFGETPPVLAGIASPPAPAASADPGLVTVRVSLCASAKTARITVSGREDLVTKLVAQALRADEEEERHEGAAAASVVLPLWMKGLLAPAEEEREAALAYPDEDL